MCFEFIVGNTHDCDVTVHIKFTAPADDLPALDIDGAWLLHNSVCLFQGGAGRSVGMAVVAAPPQASNM